MANITVVYDASVLYPAPLRDLLMWLALTDLFKARWTEEIHQEWIRNVLKNRSPCSGGCHFNLKDFPPLVLANYGVEAIHPDEFILDLIDIDSSKVCQSAQKQRKTLKNPPLTLEQYLDTLMRQGLPQSATALGSLLAN